MEGMRSIRVKFVHLVIVTLIGFPIGPGYAQNNVGSAPPLPWILKPVGPLRSVTHGVFHFIWNRDQVLKIDSTPAKMRAAGTAATFEESGVVLGDTAIRARSLTVFFAQDEAADGVKAVGIPGIDGRTIGNIEARNVIIRGHDQIAIGDFITIDFRTGVANLNEHVIVAQRPNSLKGKHLFLDLRTGTSRLEGHEFWKVY